MADNKPITAEQMRAARALLRLSQEKLSIETGVSIPTIKRMEGGTGAVAGTYTNVSKIVSTLEKNGIQFVKENGGGCGVRFKERSG